MVDMSSRDVRSLPKAHLHLHVTGSVRPSTLRELAARAGTAAPEFARRYPSWDVFATAYRSIKPLLRTAEDLHRIIVELIEDDAASGAVWTELSISPSGSHRSLTGSDTATMDIVTDAISTAAAGVAGVVVAADRVRDAHDPESVARLAAAWADHGVVGFGLAGDESSSCRPFARAAAIARDAGLVVVPHAGETGGPTSIREALDVLRPDRLMHGVRAVEDPALVSELADRGIGLDVCPTSNAALGVVTALEDHLLADLRRAGVRCSLNADDTLVFDTNLAREYRTTREVLGLPDRDLADIARTSLDNSGAPAAVVQAAHATIDDWLATPPSSPGPGPPHDPRSPIRASS